MSSSSASCILLTLCIDPFRIPFVQADETAVPTLDQIIVTGSAHPTRLHRSTQSYTIVDHPDYAPFQPNRLSSILQQVPGIHLDEMGGRGGITSIDLRGVDPNFTLIMLDGIPLNDSTDQRAGFGHHEGMGVSAATLTQSPGHIPSESDLFEHPRDRNGRRVEKLPQMEEWVKSDHSGVSNS